MAKPIEYAEEGLLPIPPSALWKLLTDHAEDSTIPRIHPKVLAQTTVRRAGDTTEVERTILAGRRQLRSRWRITHRPPDFSRWEVLGGEGPWSAGTFMENRYSAEPAGTRIRSRGELRISVLPFFLPQARLIARVLNEIEEEDLRFVARSAASAATPPAP